MDEEEAIDQFKKIELFADFDINQLRLLAFVSETVEVARGDFVYRAGDAADGAYILVSGILEGLAGDADAEASGYRVGPPALLGELGLMLKRRRATSFRARTLSRLLFIPREPFLKLMRNNPDLAESVSATLRAELTGYLDSIAQLAPRFVREDDERE